MGGVQIHAAEALPVLGRDVGTAAIVILDDVAQNVGELHRHAQVVGQAVCLVAGSAVAEDRQAQPPHRAGDAAAIADQFIEGLVLGSEHVQLDTLDQHLECVDRQPVLLGCVGERGHDRIARVGAALGERCYAAALQRELLELLARSNAPSSPMSSTRRAKA